MATNTLSMDSQRKSPISKRATTHWMASKIVVESSVSRSLTCGDALGEAEGALRTASNGLELCRARRLSWSPALMNLLSNRIEHALRLLRLLDQSFRGLKSTASPSSSARRGLTRKG